MFLDGHFPLRHSSSALKCARKEDVRDQWTSDATRAHRRRYGGVGSVSNLTLDRTQVRPWFFNARTHTLPLSDIGEHRDLLLIRGVTGTARTRSLATIHATAIYCARGRDPGDVRYGLSGVIGGI